MKKNIICILVCIMILSLMSPTADKQVLAEGDSSTMPAPSVQKVELFGTLPEKVVPTHYMLEEPPLIPDISTKSSGIEEALEQRPSGEVIALTRKQVKSFSCAIVTDVPQTECEALVALYNSTNGAGWTNKDNWLVSTVVGDWFGITVSSRRVIRIDLYSNNLVGMIPSEIDSLINLQGLSLNTNQLSGAIPPELGSLTNLQELSLNSNQLSGSIPPELGNLTNLQYLYLYSNQLAGSIPPELGNLTNLQYLSLSFNQLTGSVPQELGRLTNARYLYLFSNQLSGFIPPTLGSLANLMYLSLSYNQLSGPIPLSFINLTNLQGFYFEDTFLCEPLDLTFQTWKATVTVWVGTGINCESFNCSGTVFLEDGSSIPDVDIIIDSVLYTTTDAHGNYSIQLEEGTHTISASRAGYIFTPNTLTVNLDRDRAGQNLVGEVAYCGDGVVAQNSIQANMCQMPFSEPFLYVPLRAGYGYDASTVMKDADLGGKVNSWFDHNKPAYFSYNGKIMLSDGIEYPSGVFFWYDGHDGLDLLPILPGDYNSNAYDIIPAASGTVIDVCHRDPFHYPNETCDNYPSEGKYVVISHRNNSYATLYGHLDSIEDWITVGANVTRNDFSSPLRIGKMGCSGMENQGCPIHLHFTVYFNHYAEDPWHPTSKKYHAAEVVDPFGWQPVDRNQDDSWSIPSVWLWKEFQPANVIPATNVELITSGSVTATIPADSGYQGTLISLFPSYFYNWTIPINRSLGKGFSLIAPILIKPKSVRNEGLDVVSTEFTDPINVQVDISDINPHVVKTELSIYQYNRDTNQWISLPTTIDEINLIASAQVFPTGFFDVQAPLVCTDDVSEPSDDNPSQRPTLPLFYTDITLIRWFDVSEDEDWISFEGLPGVTYTIQTQNLADGVDTILSLYTRDGMTQISTNDNSGGGLSSRLVFTPEERGLFYIRVSQGDNSAFGCDSSYELRFTNDMKSIFLPIINR